MSYFTLETFRFLRLLARHNERDWFHANKARYEQHVRDPFLRLIADLGPPLAKISPHFRADPRPVGGSLFRIQRDTRFSGNKAPYKTSAGARLMHVRRREVAAPSFYIHIAPGECFVGAGIWHPEPETLRRLRSFMHDNPRAWIAATRSAGFKRQYQFWGESLTRIPAGIEADHPLLDDLKRKNQAAGTALEDATVLGPRLKSTLVGHLRRLAPMMDYLCAALDLEFA
jgi:uncharacterized protein (TIGR02453 family)